MKFNRAMGPAGLMFAAVSGVLGSAWLFSPYYAVQHSGPAALIAWLVGWFAMLLIAMTFAELVTAFPVSGGNARYMHVTHGPLVGFAFSWVMWLGFAAVAPVETMGVLQYLSSLWSALTYQVNGVPLLTHLGYLIAAVVLFFMCWVNLFGIKWVARYNNVMVWVKMIVPIVVAVVLLTTQFHMQNFSHVSGFMPYGWHSVAVTLSVGGVIFAFAGYAPAIVLAGEAKNPQKTIPLILVGSLTICLLLYLLLQITLIGAVDKANLTAGWAKLHYANDTSPFLGLAESLGLSSLKYLIFLTAVLAPLGTAFIFVTTSSRVAYAMGRNEYFPSLFVKLSKRGVPFAAVMLNFVVGMILFFPAPGWQGMVGFLVSAFVLCYGIGPIALLCLRQQAPEIKRPFKLPWAKSWCFIAFSIANLIVYWTGWAIVSKMLLAIALGFIVLIIMSIRKPRRWAFRQGFWVILYFACMGIISFLGRFNGGLNILPEGVDEATIFIMSGIVLWLAYHFRAKEYSLDHLR